LALYVELNKVGPLQQCNPMPASAQLTALHTVCANSFFEIKFPLVSFEEGENSLRYDML